MIVKLQKKQFDYLNYSLSEEKKTILKQNQIGEDNQFIIEIDENAADAIRDWASDELQKKGFDLNYELTHEGEILENLIDAFYISCK